MSKNDTYAIIDGNPAAILGVSADDSAEVIRAAYLNKVKQYPPERCPDEFERIRDAYTVLSDPRRRMRTLLRAMDLETDLSTLNDSRPKQRRFIGPGPWLEAMRTR